MGAGRFDDNNWQTLSVTRSSMSRNDMFQSSAKNEFLPHSVKGGVRESVDSVDNPNSRPIMVFMDATGSMGHIPQYMATTGIGEVMANILKYQPVVDPHVLIGVFSDAKGDTNPLQVAQFEADNRIAEQAVQFKLGGGGQQDSESYDYPWLFAATMTKTDAWDKRGQKGYLFTMGDEPAPQRINTPYELRAVFGDKFNRDYTSAEMLQLAREKWIVFHIVIEEGSRGSTPQTARTWKELMGPNCLFLDKSENLAQLITATIAYTEGNMSMDKILENAGSAKSSVQRAFSMLQEYA
jgi:hypothetical protein